MDRFTARSHTQPPPASTPYPSLTNVSKESKRHCRLLHAGMVNLTLAQMTAAVTQEEQMNKEKPDHCDQIDEVAQYAVRRRKMRQERKERNVEGRKKTEEKKAVRFQEKRTKITEPDDFDKMLEACESLTVAPQKASMAGICECASSPMVEVSFDEMFKRCDALLLPPDSPSVIISAPKTRSTEPSTPATAMFYELPELHARNTDTTRLTPHPAKPSTASTTLNTHAAPPSTHPLHANPPSASDIRHARNMTAAHRHQAAVKKSKVRNSHRALATSKKPEVTHTHSALAAFDAVTQYGKMAPRTKMTRYVSVARRAKLSMREALGRGVGRLLGE